MVIPIISLSSNKQIQPISGLRVGGNRIFVRGPPNGVIEGIREVLSRLSVHEHQRVILVIVRDIQRRSLPYQVFWNSSAVGCQGHFPDDGDRATSQIEV